LRVLPAIRNWFAGMARSYKFCVLLGAYRSGKVTYMPDYKPGHAALRKGRVSVSNGVYLVTSTTLHRARAFENFHAACAAARCFEDRAVLGDAAMLAWVLMPDHAHWLVELSEHDVLGMVVNRIKSASARHANKALNREGALWSVAYHDHALRVVDDLQDTARYVVANPLRAGLVKSLGDYPFWNAIWL
jgi:putative transposase